MTRTELGDGVTLEHQVEDTDGELTDATVTIDLTAPNGTITQPAITHLSTGRYRTTGLVPDALGKWTYVVRTTGAVTSVAYGSFLVVAAPISEPDRLASVDDLLRMPGVPADFDRDEAGLLIEVATAVVQAAAGGQRILEVVDDEVTLYGGTDSLLALPQRPVTSVKSVTHDGTLLTQGSDNWYWSAAPNAIYRAVGWTVYGCARPVPTTVVYTHGYPDGHQMLQLARSATLSLAKGIAINPTGITRMAIDDYQEAYDRASAALEASTSLAGALRRQYGRKAGSVRIV